TLDKNNVDQTNHLVSCGQLSYLKRFAPAVFYDTNFRASYIGLLINCGEANPILYDSTAITKQILSFLYNILGTLMVIALVIAGFMYIFDKSKEANEGRKRLQMIFIGAILTMVAAPLIQLAINLIQTQT